MNDNIKNAIDMLNSVDESRQMLDEQVLRTQTAQVYASIAIAEQLAQLNKSIAAMTAGDGDGLTALRIISWQGI